MKILTTFLMTSAFALGGFGAWKLHGGPEKKTPPVEKAKPAAVESAAAEVIVPAEAHREAAEGLALPTPPELVNLGIEEPAGEVAPDAAKSDVQFETVELITAAQQGIIAASITANARELAIAALHNNSPAPVRVLIPAGQVMESGRNAVVVLRNVEVGLMPGEKTEVSIRTAALHSSNRVGNATYRLSYQAATKVQLFLTWLGDHPEISTPAAQTAILALTENLPLSAFAKFAPANGIRSKLDTDAFRVETSDIISALRALRESGVGIDNLALMLDPQLRIEAMIEPLSREDAKRFYGIADSAEWEFWKRELLHGDPSTRHYALFGIARFYPEIAIEMLPRWVRETKTHPVYRVSAVQALADTQREQALPLLRQLAEELGPETDLGRAATQAADFLDQRLTQLANAAPVVAFRGKDGVSGF